MAYTEEELKKELESQEYQYGFTTDIDSETFPVGLNEDIVKAISKKKNEPEWMTQWRLEAYSSWKDMEEPNWHNVKYKKPDFQAISYFSAPKTNKYKSLDEVDPELIKTFNKLGISIEEQKKLAGVAVDIVMDSVSVATTFRETLAEKGIIFCSISEAIKDYPELVKKILEEDIFSERSKISDDYFSLLNLQLHHKDELAMYEYIFHHKQLYFHV